MVGNGRSLVLREKSREAMEDIVVNMKNASGFGELGGVPVVVGRENGRLGIGMDSEDEGLGRGGSGKTDTLEGEEEEEEKEEWEKKGRPCPFTMKYFVHGGDASSFQPLASSLLFETLSVTCKQFPTIRAKFPNSIAQKLKTDTDIPSDEEDLALPALIHGDEIEVEHSVSAIVVWQGRRQIIVALAGSAYLIDGDEPRSLVDLEHDVSVHLLPLHLHERVLAFIRHPHSSGRLSTIIN
ncbi:hypothetical protein G2W53_031764 [Senna tora]|uniref:Uncharacterized protein n=1 Tax=Senna tora TaxID=362788 RepID=A0A834SUH8_9FABA|nr:hypothetical protein G2W53_031764 [Senna tora]